MGDMSLIGDPDRNTGNYAENNSFYYLSNTVQNNIDIRTYRTADLNIRVFSYLTTIDIDDSLNDLVLFEFRTFFFTRFTSINFFFNFLSGFFSCK